MDWQYIIYVLSVLYLFFHRIKKASTISEQMLNEQLKDQQHHITDLSSELKHHQNICTELSNELGVLQTGMEQVI